jgi:hypothetical protein
MTVSPERQGGILITSSKVVNTTLILLKHMVLGAELIDLVNSQISAATHKHKIRRLR